ncbi:hypothetical protein [Nitrosomonas sp. Nm33]|uniref:hypothetical protein n=1 Tax=Nitrosomonas sp. Nm33 TaxID=133724 RepID=UPI0008996471|nr:hypothetical protein [Nitrosomonas sp. Nm33]SDY92102.1 hypothetical protein SAMN05421755_10655 [Nitrosomonas sp. Nm33]
MNSSRTREIRLWWPLPLAVLLWLIAIWAVGFFLTEPEIKVSIDIPDAIEAEFLELPELAQPQESVPPPRKGIETQPQNEAQQAKIAPELVMPPPPRPRPRTPPKPPPVKKDAIETAKATPPRKESRTEAPQKKDAAAPVDLSEYINQRRRQQSRPAGIFDGIENSKNINPKPQPSAEEIRMATVKRNLQMPGTSGVFQIIKIGPRYAQFTFRAWTTGDSNPRRELIEVKAGPDGDIERAIIRRMIQLIRQYHQEDFNWESPRLNRVVVLSARPGDSEGLENFLMREFFGEPIPPYLR